MSKPRLLHINSYFIDNHLYSKVYKELDSFCCQVAYVPIKLNRNEENSIELRNGQIHFSKIIQRKHIVLYFNKIDCLYNDILKRGLNKGVDIVHAHNLFTDGALAYRLKKAFGLKYVVSVRTTDILLQYKYMWHRRRFAREILAEAEHVVFISTVYKDLLFSFFKSDFRQLIKVKTSIIPNGIDDFWLNQSPEKRHIKTEEPIKLLFVGQIIPRKNVLRLLNAIELLRQKKVNLMLTIVGGGSADEAKYYKKVLEKVKCLSNVNLVGKVNNKELLRTYFQTHHIFVMPSEKELFGLTYIEALSQNLPVVYSKGEGIVPYLDGQPFGVGVDANNSGEIADGILSHIKDYDSLNGMSEFARKFNWPDVVIRYRKIYDNMYE